MRAYWIAFAGLAQGVCLAQSTFNVVHNYTVQQGWPDAGGASGRSAVETDSGFFVLGHQVATAGLTKNFSFLFNATGGWIGDAEFNALDPSDQNFGYIDPVHKDGLGAIAAMSSFDSANDSTRQIALARIGMDGALVWQTSITDSCFCGAQQVRGRDGRFALVGFNGFDAMLLFCDSAGVVDTMRTYADTRTGLSVRPLAGGSEWLIAGYQSGGVDDAIWVMRVDSVGNTIWRRNIGGSLHAFKNVSAIQTQDGGIVATCSYMPLPGSWNSPQWNYFRKWDIDGNVMWTEQFNQQPENTTFDLEELPDGALVACGTETSFGFPNSKALLMKLEPDGDLVWLRRYFHYADGNGHLPYDLEPTSDGGFVLTGYAKQGWDDTIPNLQMVWLLKVDSMGCLVPGCGWDGMEEVALGLENALGVYPNPARGTATVTATLPSDLQVRGTLRLVLVDALGRTVREQNVGHSFSSTSLDLSGLAAGVHYLHLRDEARWLSGVRLVVE